VQELLGRRPGEVRTWAEHMQKLLEIRMQKELSEAEQLLADAEKQIAAADYDKAIDNIKKVQLRVSIDDRLKWGDVPQRAKGLMDKAVAERDVANQAKREAAEREAYEIAQREEEQARIKRKARIDYLMALGTKAYERRDFAEARRLAEEALREEPTHEMATQLAAASEKAYRDRVTDDYVVQKAREFRRFQEQQQELKIPYTDILTAPDPTYWADISKKRQMATAEEQVRAAKDTETLAVEAALERRLPKGLQFDETSGAYAEVIQALSTMTEVPIVITPEAKEVIDSNSLVLQIQLGQPITLRNFLNLMVDRSDKALAYVIQDGAVLFTTKAKALGAPTLRVHPIADLTFPVTNFAGPLIRDLPVGTESTDEAPRAGGEVGDKVRFVEPEALTDLIKKSVSPTSWDGEGVSMESTAGNLVVRQTPEVQAKIEAFLNDLRKFQTSLVTVESKFLRVSRNWLQQIGVDIRGLGGANAKGSVVQLDDITNGLINNSSQGLDNSGTGDASGHPNAGFFYDDGLDGDFRGRSENYFTNALGNLLTPKGGMTFGLTLLDDSQLNILLRAVEKNENIQVVDSQSLTVMNGQRAYISVINQTAFVQDFSVEVATASFIADPEVNFVQDGVVLDVRPTISYDRKYITLDLQPTVAELTRPIPTFSTSLSGSTLPVLIQFPQLTVRSAATHVKVPDGGSVLIGGLNEILNKERRATVPWLGSLPLVSFLFKEEGTVDENSSLMVLVKAYITNVKEFMESRTVAAR
jgi:type II secretory pathway component GspD/PulD (secretin)